MTKIKDKNNQKVRVITTGGDIPFSVGYLANALLAIGLAQDRAYRDAYSISVKVAEFGKTPLTSDEIMEITKTWYEDRAPSLALRIQILRNNLQEIKPLVILLGGVTGIGKSTLAQLLATRLGIRSIIGTDLIREVIRVTISPALMPTLHTSSYIAHAKLDTSFLPALSKCIVGFEAQARSVIVGVEAAIEQAIVDNEILIIEGVHLVPGLIRKKLMKHQAIIAFQLVLNDEDMHSSRLARRESKKNSRATTYSTYFQEIRQIQSYLIDQANNHNIPLIDIENDEKALLKLINDIWNNKLTNE